MATDAVTVSPAYNGDSVPLTVGMIVRLKPGANNNVVRAQADSAPHAQGVNGVVISGASAPTGVVGVVCTGRETVQMESGLTPAVGDTVYVSPTVAGKGTNVLPVNVSAIGTVADISNYARSGTVEVTVNISAVTPASVSGVSSVSTQKPGDSIVPNVGAVVIEGGGIANVDSVNTSGTTLSALSAADFPVGNTFCWVASLGAYFQLQISALPVDHITVETASGLAGAQWLRMTLPSCAWLAQPVWWVDPANSSGMASDFNSGETSTSPLATFAELSRRLANGFVTIALITINLMSDAAASDPLVLSNIQTNTGPFIKVIGQTTTIASGISISAARNPVVASNDHFEITTGSAYASWLANNYLLERTNGTPAYSWPYKDLGGGKLQISLWLDEHGSTVETISPGDSLSVFALPTFAGVITNNISPLIAVSVQQVKMIGWTTAGNRILLETVEAPVELRRVLLSPPAFPISFVTQTLNGYIGLNNVCAQMAAYHGIAMGWSGPGFRISGGLYIGDGTGTEIEVAECIPVVIGGAAANTFTLGGVLLLITHLSSIQKLWVMVYDTTSIAILSDLGSVLSLDQLGGERNTGALLNTQRQGVISSISGFGAWIDAATSSPSPYVVNGVGYDASKLGIDTNQIMTLGGGIIGNAGWSGGLSGVGANPDVVAIKESGGTNLPIGSIPANAFLQRNGSNVVGVSATDATNGAVAVSLNNAPTGSPSAPVRWVQLPDGAGGVITIPSLT